MTDNAIISPDHQIRVHDRTFRPYIRRDEIQELVHDIAKRINHDFAGQEVTALVILKGAMVFAADLIRQLSMPVIVEFTRASSYGNSMTSAGTTAIEGLLADVTDRNVIIIEDIVDTGTTIRDLIKHLGGLQPRSITIAALLSKPSVHKDTLTIDYVGREIAPDFVVGYGMDYACHGRQLDAIWVVTEEPTA
ncbi:MAG: hypoxanthine phosphoribosyltransferase [Candidatus Kapabacteria bacterium]|nr:hypoxanthine phosphoribosyltransferase [Candidatus Kapabacteria bacterium]MBP7093695.1 hypoxanthine phosphoribosyltransferase [Candidatus Kapabacteria bacterium]